MGSSLQAQNQPLGEEVVFKSGNVILNGTLILPDSAKNTPVLVFLGGIYDWGELHPVREYFIRENLEAIFKRAGIGIFYYSPRGIKQSTGRWGKASMTDFANDAKAAIRYLTQRKEIDPDRIGIIGLGEDGWTAQIVAATAPDQVKLMANLASPTFDAKKYLVNEYHNQYICNGETDSIALQKAEQKALSHQNWVSWLPVTKSWRHLNMKTGFDPAPYLREITVPSLFLFAENDSYVYPSWATESLNELFDNSLPSNFKVQTIPNTNHYFHVVERCYEYPNDLENLQINFSFRFREVFQDWIFENL